MSIVSQSEIEFYKRSLQEACDYINHSTITLKAIVGTAYEQHRKRVWEHFGFTVDKEKHNAMWDVDLTIYKGHNVIAFEETKGHYLDSCFLDRALMDMTKTLSNYITLGEPIPMMILHSFTNYSKFQEKNEEFYLCLLGMGNPEESIDKLKEKIVYTKLTYCGRLSKNSWFQICRDAYIDNVKEDLIIEDIKFIKSFT